MMVDDVVCEKSRIWVIWRGDNLEVAQDFSKVW